MVFPREGSSAGDQHAADAPVLVGRGDVQGRPSPETPAPLHIRPIRPETNRHSRVIVGHVQDGAGSACDQVLDHVLVPVPGRVMQRRLPRRVDREERVTLVV